MSEKTVKVEIELPAELHRFFKAICEFGGLDINEHLKERLIRDIASDFGNFDSEGCFGVGRRDLMEKYGLETLLQEYALPEVP